MLRLEGSESWTPLVVQSIAGRIYAPFADEPGSPGRFRIERFTYTSDWVRPAGTRIRVRSGVARIESVDLTPAGDEPSD